MLHSPAAYVKCCADCYTPELLAADGEQAIPGEAVPLLVSPFMRLLAELRQAAGTSRVM
jgi:hypothetical protein